MDGEWWAMVTRKWASCRQFSNESGGFLHTIDKWDKIKQQKGVQQCLCTCIEVNMMGTPRAFFCFVPNHSISFDITIVDIKAFGVNKEL